MRLHCREEPNPQQKTPGLASDLQERADYGNLCNVLPDLMRSERFPVRNLSETPSRRTNGRRRTHRRVGRRGVCSSSSGKQRYWRALQRRHRRVVAAVDYPPTRGNVAAPARRSTVRTGKRDTAESMSGSDHPVSAQPTAAGRSLRTAANSYPARVLVLDDDLGTLETFAVILKEAGYLATVASAPSRAIEEARRFSFNLALVDLRLGQSCGLQAIRPLSPTPVVIVTGFADIPSAVQAVKMGAVDYVEKPLIGEGLIAVVERNLLDQRKVLPLAGILKSSVAICEFARLAAHFRDGIVNAES
jgi:ActR/RegA family two-component response regulator